MDVAFHLPVSFIGLIFVSMLLLDKPKVTLPLNEFSTIKFVSAICILFVSLSPLFLGTDWWHLLGVRATILGITMFVGMFLVLQGILWHMFFVQSLPTFEAKDE